MVQTSVQLSAEQHEQMKTQGFIILDQFFGAQEIEELERRLGDFHHRHEELLKAKDGSEGINRAGEILFSTHIAEEDEFVKDFTRNAKMTELSIQLLGPDVDLFWNQTVYKNPETTKEFPWHQDDAYGPVTPSPYLTCWLAISDATLDNGCISVIPGSHVGGLRPHQETPLGFAGHPADDPDQGIKVPVSRGSVIVFWSTVLHKSGPNLSDGMRKAYVIQYCKHGTTKIGEPAPIPNLIPVARNSQAV
jgi:phytanoyl-CoA hydroxylase